VAPIQTWLLAKGWPGVGLHRRAEGNRYSGLVSWEDEPEDRTRLIPLWQSPLDEKQPVNT